MVRAYRGSQEERQRSFGLFSLEDTGRRPHHSLQPLCEKKRRETLISTWWLIKTKGTAWSWVTGGLGWILGKVFSPRVVGRWNKLPREVTSAWNLPEFIQDLDNALRHMMQLLVLSCVGPAVGHDEPCRPLHTQDIILWFQAQLLYALSTGMSWSSEHPWRATDVLKVK